MDLGQISKASHISQIILILITVVLFFVYQDMAWGFLMASLLRKNTYNYSFQQGDLLFLGIVALIAVIAYLVWGWPAALGVIIGVALYLILKLVLAAFIKD